MIRLFPDSGPIWLDLGLGVRVKAKPLTLSRDARIRESIDEVAKDAIEMRQKYRDLGGHVNDSDIPSRTELHVLALAKELVVDWEGIGDKDGVAAPCTQENLALFANNVYLGHSFLNAVMRPIMDLESEKNVSSPSADGTSEAGLTVAKPADPLEKAAQ